MTTVADEADAIVCAETESTAIFFFKIIIGETTAKNDFCILRPVDHAAKALSKDKNLFDESRTM